MDTLNAMESCIDDLEKNRPDIWKVYLQTKELLAYLEKKLVWAKAQLDKERKSKEAEIQSRGGWHM
jgi:hypothetical protein